MKLSRYLTLATTPIAAVSIFNIYRRLFDVELKGWLQKVADGVIGAVVEAPPKFVFDWDPPQILSDFWVFSLWWTGVMAAATVGAMKDKGAPTPWYESLMMIPIRLFLGYSLIGFFWAAAVVPITFAKFKTGDDDLDRYGHWIRVFTSTCISLVIVLFALNTFVD